MTAITLYRPEGPKELALIEESGWREFSSLRFGNGLEELSLQLWRGEPIIAGDSLPDGTVVTILAREAHETFEGAWRRRALTLKSV